ncbi:MAG TPA: hypothetical protein VEZ72_24815, partial [Paenibacillus sp.]|nr:hypothetical protein [Paenibacillus sp.]
GKIGEVSVPIPVGGYGEVGFTFGHGMVYHTANSVEADPIPAGARVLAIGLFFFYVKPMSQAENSVAYSMGELEGKIGEVSVPIPVGGFGEVGFTFGHGLVFHTAQSVEAEPIPAGERVLAIEVKDGVVAVCRWTESYPIHN